MIFYRKENYKGMQVNPTDALQKADCYHHVFIVSYNKDTNKIALNYNIIKRGWFKQYRPTGMAFMFNNNMGIHGIEYAIFIVENQMFYNNMIAALDVSHNKYEPTPTDVVGYILKNLEDFSVSQTSNEFKFETLEAIFDNNNFYGQEVEGYTGLCGVVQTAGLKLKSDSPMYDTPAIAVEGGV